MEDNNKYIIPMIDRAFEIINLIYDSNQHLGVTEISKKLEIPKATVYRILYTLGKWDFVQKDSQDDGYFLGKAFIKYSSKVKADISIITIASDHIDQLAKEIGESANIGVPYNEFVLTVYNAKGEDFYLVSNLIPISPLNCSSMGKIYLSEYSDEDLEKYFDSDKPQSRTINSVSNLDDFLELKREIKEEGISYDREEYEYGLTCLAVPIRDFKKQIIATISISGPTSRLRHKGMDYLKENIIKTRDDIQKSLEGIY